MEEILEVNGKPYRILKLLGKGKGGYSYLAEDAAGVYVLKQIHHEPCDYYQFGDKLASEKKDYMRLLAAGIRMPKLLDTDEEKERILKEYIEGPTIYELVLWEQMSPSYTEQIHKMCRKLYAEGLNIDYFPTNFVVREELLYYVDYECNEYHKEWNFENWGSRYWAKTQEFMQYVREHDGGL